MIVCADDYGLSADINHAILKLCAARKLSAVSCMTALERCDPAALRELGVQADTVDVGLHLVLTDEHLPWSRGLTRADFRLVSFGDLLRRCLLRRVCPEHVLPWITLQYEFFIEKLQRAPDFIDGHLHVHQFPGIREALTQFVLSLPAGSRPYVRNTRMNVRELRGHGLPWLKAALIGRFGAKMASLLCSAGVETNNGFAGIYDFRNWSAYSTYLPAFAACLRHRNGMLVVHPGTQEDWRRAELEAISAFFFPPGMPDKFRA